MFWLGAGKFKRALIQNKIRKHNLRACALNQIKSIKLRLCAKLVLKGAEILGALALNQNKILKIYRFHENFQWTFPNLFSLPLNSSKSDFMYLTNYWNYNGAKIKIRYLTKNIVISKKALFFIYEEIQKFVNLWVELKVFSHTVCTQISGFVFSFKWWDKNSDNVINKCEIFVLREHILEKFGKLSENPVNWSKILGSKIWSNFKKSVENPENPDIPAHGIMDKSGKIWISIRSIKKPEIIKIP